MKYYTLPAFVLLMLPAIVQGQHFSYKAKLPPVANTAFHRITITPEIAAYSQVQFEDLRLFDNDGKEVPYLLKKEVSQQSETEFVTYPTNTSIETNRQTVIIENKARRRVEQFLFEIKNAVASRLVRISGSTDNTTWYVVRDSFYFEAYEDNDESMTRRALNFPGTDYPYYKIEIANGNNESPLNIMRVGNYNTTAKEAGYQRVPGLSFSRTEAGKITYLQVKCRPGNRIDKLVFQITGPEMYKRQVMLKKNMQQEGYQVSPDKYKRTPITDYRDYELTSVKTAGIDCSDFLGYSKDADFTIEIVNQDNEPLQIKAIEAYQLTTAITANLDKDKTYFLYFGDSLLQQPGYDIVYFESKIPRDVVTINPMALLPKEQKDKDEYNAAKDKYIVWIGLGVAGVILFALTMSMMKKMKDQ